MSQFTDFLHKHASVIKGVTTILGGTQLETSIKKSITTEVVKLTHVQAGGTWDTIISDSLSILLDGLFAIADATINTTTTPTPTPANTYEVHANPPIPNDQALITNGFKSTDNIYVVNGQWYVLPAGTLAEPGSQLVRVING